MSGGEGGAGGKACRHAKDRARDTGQGGIQCQVSFLGGYRNLVHVAQEKDRLMAFVMNWAGAGMAHVMKWYVCV